MLNQIKAATGLVEAGESAIDLLLACHQRIRHFTALAERLAHATDVPPEEVASAAGNLLRYFEVALPLHEADEDVSLRPHLLRTAPADALEATGKICEQHQMINGLKHQLLPMWRALEREPKRLAEFAPRMKELTAELRKLFAIHLKLEEEVVFPAAQKYVGEKGLRQVHDEMRQRRGLQKE